MAKHRSSRTQSLVSDSQPRPRKPSLKSKTLQFFELCSIICYLEKPKLSRRQAYNFFEVQVARRPCAFTDLDLRRSLLSASMKSPAFSPLVQPFATINHPPLASSKLHALEIGYLKQQLTLCLPAASSQFTPAKDAPSPKRKSRPRFTPCIHRSG